MTSSSQTVRRTLYIQRPGVKNVLSQLGKNVRLNAECVITLHAAPWLIAQNCVNDSCYACVITNYEFLIPN